MLLGYARCSTTDQDPALQLDALTAAGCDRIWTETASGAAADRPQLADLLSHARDGDALVVWAAGPAGPGSPHLIALLADLEHRGVQLVADRGTGHLDRRRAAGVPHLRLDRRLRATAGAGAHSGRVSGRRARGRVGGRPTVMTPAKTRTARRMLTDGEPMTAVAAALSVSRTTLYRHLGTPAQT